MAEPDLLQNDSTFLKMNLKGHSKTVTDLTFNPINQQQFASSSADKSVMMWNMQQNSKSYSFTGHTDTVTGIEYSSNGALLATSSNDCTVRLWVPSIKGGSSSFKAHTSAVKTLAFSPLNDQLIITGGNDKCIKLWNVARKQFLSSFTGHTNWIRDVKFTPDGKSIISCSDDGTIRIWDVDSSQCVHAYKFPKDSPTHVSVHKNGNSIAVGTSTGFLRIYNIKANKLQQHYSLFESPTSVCWHPTDNYVLCGGDKLLIIVDVMEGRPLYTVGGHEGDITCAKFSPNGDYFASSGSDKHIMVWQSNFAK